MKRILLVFTLIIGAISFTSAQKSVGGGIVINGLVGIEAKGDIWIADPISISPSIAYFLTNADYSLLGLNADVHYNFEIQEKLDLYPLLGLSYYTYSGVGYSFGGGIGLNAGGGGRYTISDKMTLYGELKFARYSIGLSAGVYFEL